MNKLLLQEKTKKFYVLFLASNILKYLQKYEVVESQRIWLWNLHLKI